MQAYSAVIGKIEDVLSPLGLMSGQYAIPKRFLFGATLGLLVVSYVMPESMFQDGEARPWSLFIESDYVGPAPTSTPWFLGPLLGAVFFGVFV